MALRPGPLRGSGRAPVLPDQARRQGEPLRSRDVLPPPPAARPRGARSIHHERAEPPAAHGAHRWHHAPEPARADSAPRRDGPALAVDASRRVSARRRASLLVHDVDGSAGAALRGEAVSRAARPKSGKRAAPPGSQGTGAAFEPMAWFRRWLDAPQPIERLVLLRVLVPLAVVGFLAARVLDPPPRARLCRVPRPRSGRRLGPTPHFRC